MRKPLKIGHKEYKFKKDAILHYQKILNSYKFGQSLCSSDFDDLNDLVDFSYLSIDESEFDIEEFKQDLQLIIKDVKIAKVKFNTKCFEIFYENGESEYISYRMIINKKTYTSNDLFNKACRNTIQKDLINVKQEYFNKNSVKGQVKCQETGILSKWAELVVDHRQPNTFSIIVDRFKEINNIELDNIEYEWNDQNHIIFKDENWTEKFRKYHMDKATLRIVRTECNSSRTAMARLKRTSKDLTIKQLSLTLDL